LPRASRPARFSPPELPPVFHRSIGFADRHVGATNRHQLAGLSPERFRAAARHHRFCGPDRDIFSGAIRRHLGRPLRPLQNTHRHPDHHHHPHADTRGRGLGRWQRRQRMVRDHPRHAARPRAGAGNARALLLHAGAGRNEDRSAQRHRLQRRHAKRGTHDRSQHCRIVTRSLQRSVLFCDERRDQTLADRCAAQDRRGAATRFGTRYAGVGQRDRRCALHLEPETAALSAADAGADEFLHHAISGTDADFRGRNFRWRRVHAGVSRWRCGFWRHHRQRARRSAG